MTVAGLFSVVDTISLLEEGREGDLHPLAAVVALVVVVKSGVHASLAQLIEALSFSFLLSPRWGFGGTAARHGAREASRTIVRRSPSESSEVSMWRLTQHQRVKECVGVGGCSLKASKQARARAHSH
jgi:hypothetical protein